MNVYTIKADNEEAAATITARTSRSPRPFSEIADEVRERGYAPFLEKNVLGYGHDSVAEGAQCPWVAVEGISDLAGNILATADPQLRVQMTSTRYQDMESRNVVHESAYEAKEYVDEVMALARYRQQQAMDTVAAKAPKHLNEVQRLTLARDISRGWMPAGIRTQLAVRHDARGMRDTICYLLGHKLQEVRVVGEKILEATRGTIETLLERHIVPAETRMRTAVLNANTELGHAHWDDTMLADAEADYDLHLELKAWTESGYRRRMRIAGCPHGPYLAGMITSDWGGYRDLRRNRTIAQDDLVPRASMVPKDPMWAFSAFAPEVAESMFDVDFVAHSFYDPYLAVMASPLSWRASGHALNWAYMLRIRSRLPGCHPAYALPMRALMRQILDEAPRLADVMGLVRAPGALGGVEFADRC